MKKAKAFTMMEIMVAIVLIGLLAAISVPVYKGYTEKVMLAEGYALLGAIKTAQQAYFSQYGNFLRYQECRVIWSDNEDILGIDARGNKYFTWFKVGDSDKSSPKYNFYAEIQKPIELRKKSNDTRLMLQYNISLGQKIVDSINIDRSWL